MKNLINYYYDLQINTYKKTNGKFSFQIKNKFYEFIPFFGDINELYNNYLLVVNENKYCHEIILNKDKKILTYYENIPYILLKKNIIINKEIDIKEILANNIPVHQQVNFEWKKLWIKKIDYYEYQMNQISHKYKILRNSFDYYIGLSEIAISLLNYIDEKEIKFFLCRKRIKANDKLDEFFNPTNFVVDTISRDLSELIKITFFTNGIDIKEILGCLNCIELNYTESLLLLSRLIYPSYYFDMYDKIIQDIVSEDKIKFYIEKNVSYETFLKEIYFYIKSKFRIPQIEWFEN